MGTCSCFVAGMKWRSECATLFANVGLHFFFPFHRTPQAVRFKYQLFLRRLERVFRVSIDCELMDD